MPSLETPAKIPMLISCRDPGRSFPLSAALFRAVWLRAGRAGTEFQPRPGATRLLRVPLAQPQWALTPSTPVGSFGRMMSNPPPGGCLAASRHLPRHPWPMATTRRSQGWRTSCRLPLGLLILASSFRPRGIRAHQQAPTPPQGPPLHRTHPPPPSTPLSPLPTPAPRGHWMPIWPWSPSTALGPFLESSLPRT